MSAQISIDIMGRSFDVITRKEEIIQAMNSTIAKELQITKGIMIAGTPLSVNDVSFLDGAAINYRFQFIFQVQYFLSTTKTIDNYYNQFRTVEVTCDTT